MRVNIGGFVVIDNDAKKYKDMMDSVSDSLHWLSVYSKDDEYQEQYENVNRFVKAVQLAYIKDEIKRRMHYEY